MPKKSARRVRRRAWRLLTALGLATAFAPLVAQAEVLKFRCTSPQTGGQQTESYFEVDTKAEKVFFPRSNPPQDAPVTVTPGEISYVSPYGYYEVKLDRRSGMVLTRTNKRIWVQNGTCQPDKGG